MPLSEHEQRLLDQIERALYAEDPKFASTVRSTDLRTHMRRRLRRAGLLFSVGFITMLVGVISNLIPVGVIGFVLMLLSMVIGLSAWKRVGSNSTLRSVDGGAQRTTRVKKSKQQPSAGSPKERLEERWRRRWEERGGPQ